MPASRHVSVSTYGPARASLQHAPHRFPNPKPREQRRSPKSDESAFPRQTGCTAWPCGLSRDRHFPLAPTGPTLHRPFAPVLQGIPANSPGPRSSFQRFLGIERHRDHIRAFPHQNLDARLGFLELPLAIGAQPHARFKQGQALLERQIALFQLLYNALELLQARFKSGRGCFFLWHRLIVAVRTERIRTGHFQVSGNAPSAEGVACGVLDMLCNAVTSTKNEWHRDKPSTGGRRPRGRTCPRYRRDGGFPR